MSILGLIAQLVFFNFILGSYALNSPQRYSTIVVPCKDSGVWIADGLVSCQYLEKPSAYGFHTNPAGFCQKYYKECCLSCSKLQKNRYATEYTKVLSAVSTSPLTTSVRSSTSSQTGVTKKSTPPSCTDSGVWLGGIISCNYLEKPSAYGIHTNTASFCQKYHKECCRTCNRLQEKVFTTDASLNIIVQPSAQSTVNIQDTYTLPSLKTECTDSSGVWIADGKVSCIFLEKPSVYGIHKSPKEFCLHHKKECCATCLKLEQNGYMSAPHNDPSASAATLSSVSSPEGYNVQMTIQESTAKIPCKDSGIWIADGLISCIYLVRPSAYGIHKNPQEFCAQHQVKCCLTCTKLKNKSFSVTPLKSTTSVMTSPKEIINSTSNIFSTTIRYLTSTKKTPYSTTKKMTLSDQIIQFQSFFLTFLQKLKLLLMPH